MGNMMNEGKMQENAGGRLTGRYGRGKNKKVMDSK